MGKNKICKKRILVILATILFLGSFIPSSVAETGVSDIKFNLNLPGLHILNKPSIQKVVNYMKSSGSFGWPQTFDKGIEDISNAIAIDSQGNIIVFGYTADYINENESDMKLDFLTVKYDSEGNELWNVTYDTGTYDFGWRVTVDSSDNILVLGYNGSSIEEIQNNDFYLRVVKYNKDGIEQWNTSYRNGIDNYPGGIAVDSNNNVIICGGYGDINALIFSCWTLKMNSEGIELWNQTYEKDIISFGSDVAVDESDNIVVGGLSASFFGQGYFFVEYNSNGNEIGVHRYNMGNQPNAIAIDSNRNIIMTGINYSPSSNSTTWLTIKCDTNGNLLWAREYDGALTDVVEDVSVDSNDNIVTVGAICFTTEFNYEHCAIIYDKNGNELCMKRPKINGIIYGVAIDSSDRIVITGGLEQPFNWDFYTDRYIDVTPPSVKMIKPEEKCLYLFNNKLFPLPKNTIIIGKIIISISAEDPSDAKKVEFYIDNVLRETISLPPYQWTWNEKLFGKHTIRTMAYDDSGSIAKYEINIWKFF